MAPVGFRFHPTEQEIIGHYLTLKINGHDYVVDDYIGEINIYRRDPWDLPDFARIQSDDQVWYFFCRLDYKYSNSKRANRATENGYWKLTGKVRDIKLKGSDEVIGTKRNLVFQYKCPDSKKVAGTSWVIHEFQSKTSPPDQRTLVLCKLKYKAKDSAANSPSDDGVMGSDVQISGAQTNILEVDPEQLPSYIRSNAADFSFLFPLQSEIGVGHGLSDEEKLFADSFLNATDEEYIEDAAFTLLTDDSQPRTLRGFAKGSNESATNVTYGDGEASNLCHGRGSSKEHRQMQMAASDDILLMGASSAGSTAIRHEKINVVHPVGGEFPRIGKTEKPKPPDFIKQEGVTHERFVSSTVSRHKAMEDTEQGTRINLRQKQSFGLMSEKDRKVSQVPYAKPDGKWRSKESTGNDRKGSFIRFETTSTSQRSSPPSASLLNAIVGLVLFVIMLRDVLFIH